MAMKQIGIIGAVAFVEYDGRRAASGGGSGGVAGGGSSSS